MNPEMQVLLDMQKRLYLGPNLDEERRAWRAYADATALPRPRGLRVTEHQIPTVAGRVRSWIYRPELRPGPMPTIVYLHGGGFVKGDPESSDSIAWGLAVQCNAVVVSVDYRLAPEHPFPAGIDDCYGVLCTISADGESFGIDAARLAVAGDSPGARYSAGISLKARDAGGPRLRAIAMAYGHGGMVAEATSTHGLVGDSDLATAKWKRRDSLLFPKPGYEHDPYAWPVRADYHGNLPPTLIHTAEIDLNRDSGRHYAAKLALAGSPVTYREAKGLIAGHMRARGISAAAKVEFDFFCNYLRNNLWESA